MRLPDSVYPPAETAPLGRMPGMDERLESPEPQRQTPDPAQVRLAMGGLFLLGAFAGLLGALLPVWSLNLELDAAGAADCFAAMGAGLLIALAAPEALRGDALSRGRLFTGGCVLAAGALVALSYAYEVSMLYAPLFGLGLSMGAVTLRTAADLADVLTPRRSATLLDLSGVSFSLGAIAFCAWVWAALDWTTPDRLLRCAAAIPLAAVWLSRKSGASPLRSRDADLPAERSDQSRPALALFMLGLFFQASARGFLGGWLAFYLTHKFGLTGAEGLAALGAFWIAAAIGRAAATRLPPLEGRLRSLAVPAAAGLLGCVFLLNTAETSGAFAGALLVGGAVGVLHPLTLGMWVRRRSPLSAQALRRFLGMTFLTGFAACWSIGPLSELLGVDAVIWSAAIAGLCATAALAAIVIETKLSRRSAAAPG